MEVEKYRTDSVIYEGELNDIKNGLRNAYSEGDKGKIAMFDNLLKDYIEREINIRTISRASGSGVYHSGEINPENE